MDNRFDLLLLKGLRAQRLLFITVSMECNHNTVIAAAMHGARRRDSILRVPKILFRFFRRHRGGEHAPFRVSRILLKLLFLGCQDAFAASRNSLLFATSESER